MSGIGVLLPNGEQQFLDSNGDPLAFGLVYTYVPGTTTPKTTWVDQALSTANTNPIVLDSGGRAIIWGNGSYRQIVVDQFGDLIWDQITSDGGVNDLQSQITAIDTQIGPLAGIGLQADVLYSSGTYTIKAAKLIVIGLAGGGGGGGTFGSVNYPSAGGAGATFVQVFSGLTVGNTLTMTVGSGGAGGAAGSGGGDDGMPTIVASGSQTIATVTANGGHGASTQTNSGQGGSLAGSYTLNLHGQDGFRLASDGGSFGGQSAMFFPFGCGGSIINNGQIILGNAVVNQDGTQGLIMVLGVW